MRFIEETISTPDRQISLGAIDGALSSDVRISTITIADRGGVWLRLDGAHLVWSRLALLSKRLEIDLLEAQSITDPPPPPPARGHPGRCLPRLRPAGHARVPAHRQAVSAGCRDRRRDRRGERRRCPSKEAASSPMARSKRSCPSTARSRPGAASRSRRQYSDATRQLALDLRLQEPPNGFVSSLLDFPGRPSLAFTIAGTGPIDAFRADVSLVAGGQRSFRVRATIRRGGTGSISRPISKGALGPLVPPAYADFVAGRSSLASPAVQTAQGGFVLDRADIRSSVLSLSISGLFAADAFPTRLRAEGTLGAADRRPVPLPAQPARPSSGRFSARSSRTGRGARSSTSTGSSAPASRATGNVACRRRGE